MLGKKAALIILSILLFASTNAMFADEVTINVTIPKSTMINVSQNALSQSDELVLSSNGHISLTIEATNGDVVSFESTQRSMTVPLHRFHIPKVKRYTYTIM